MPDYPLVTVYIPTHNRAPLLARALDSVLAQTYTNMEIIVVDDGSSHETYRLMEDYVKQGVITYLRNKQPLGACHARNRAIEAATGVYITGLDDDDYFEPDRISSFVAAIDAKYSFLCSNYRVITATGKSRTLLRFARDLTLADLLRENLVGNQLFTRTDYMRAVGGFDPAMPAWQDYDVWLRIAERFGRGRRLANASYVMDKSHPHERISANPEKIHAAFRYFTEKHAAFLGSTDIQGLAFSLKEYDPQFTLADLLHWLPTSFAGRALKLYLSRKRQ